ncbi:MAG TPA: hypothetical protein VJ890_23785, partial [Vineibacter sp.]|nr:hypothetical protein [Vineibacter sp.]
VKWLSEHTPGDSDLLTALHGFQLHSMVYFFFEKVPKTNKLRVVFTLFAARIDDRYDFDPDEYFPVPNPDYKNPLKISKPVAPALERMLVYHRNAKRMEKAGLAAPFDIKSYYWVDESLMSPAEIDPAKKL